MAISGRRAQLLLDLLTVAVFGAVTVPLSLVVVGSAHEAAWPFLLAAALAMTVAVGFARRWPAAALAIAWATAIMQVWLGLPPAVANVAVFWVLFATGAHERQAVRVAGLVSAVVGALVVAVYLAPARMLPLLTFALAGFALAWTFGRLVGMARQAHRERQEMLLAQREIAAEQERVRIARDMHDVVAHSLAVIVAQADGARYASMGSPEKAGEALATISGIAREALADVRVLLARLRHAQADLPQPGLGELQELIGQVRAAGLAVDADLGHPPDAVPAVTQLALYRVAQESLTNALRHGDTSKPAALRLDWDDAEVRLQIRSHLSTAPAKRPGMGHGLAGMAERARIAGGTLAAGPEGDQFVVTAVLPRGWRSEEDPPGNSRRGTPGRENT